MAVRLCTVSARWPQNEIFGGCGLDRPSTSKDKPAILLGTMAYSIEETSSDELKADLKNAFKVPDETYDIWRWRTIFTLMQHETIFCINFIPKQPEKFQVIHAMRSKKSLEDLKSLQVYFHHLVNLKYLLPVKELSQVFILKDKNITGSVGQFESSIQSAIEQALACLIEDQFSQGLAVTLNSEPEKLETYLWLKG